MRNVLTAGQIPTSCEQAFYFENTARSIDGRCGKPVTHTLETRLVRSEDERIPVRKYICYKCSLRPWVGIITSLSDYNLEVAS